MDINLKKYLPMAVTATAIFYLGNRLSFIYRNVDVSASSTRLLETMNHLNGNLIGLISTSPRDIFIGFISVFIVFIILAARREQNAGNFRNKEEYGSARWGNRKDIKPFISKNRDNRIILSQSESILMNERPDNPKYQRNQNVLVVGGSGSGKTRFVVKPNLMQLNSSYVVTDPKGSLVKETGAMFKKAGYRIKVVDTINLNQSMHYNPFHYIKSEADIIKFVDILIANTTSPEAKSNDEFWVNGEKLYYMAIIGLMFEMGLPNERNFQTMVRLVNAASVEEDDPNHKSPVDRLFEELEEDKPNCFAVSQYKKFKLGAGKTLKSILVSCGIRLAPFDIQELKEMTSFDELELDKLGEEKTVLFLTLSDNVTTFNFILGMLYSQLFNILIESADRVPGQKLRVPVQLYLDEFANIGTIPDFERLIAIIRSRGISAVIVLQALSQLKNKYKDSADTISGNCDSFIFLGGKETSTLKEVSELLGKETIDYRTVNRSTGNQESFSQNRSITGRELMTPAELAVMDNSDCIVTIRGVHPFKSKKFNIENHPRYHELHNQEGDGNLFDVSKELLTHKNDEEIQTRPKSFELTAVSDSGDLETYTFDPNNLDEKTILKPFEKLN